MHCFQNLVNKSGESEIRTSALDEIRGLFSLSILSFLSLPAANEDAEKVIFPVVSVNLSVQRVGMGVLVQDPGPGCAPYRAPVLPPLLYRALAPLPWICLNLSNFDLTVQDIHVFLLSRFQK